MKLLRLLGVFLLGVAVAAIPLIPAVFPAEVYGAWCRLRHGAEPSETGLVMTLEPVGPGEGSADGGPWIRVVFTNITDHPVTLALTEETGGELGFHATDAEGNEVLPGPLYDPARELEVSWVRRHTLPPRGRLGLLVDLSRWLKFPGPGVYTVRGDRALDKAHWKSDAIQVRVPDRT